MEQENIIATKLTDALANLNILYNDCEEELESLDGKRWDEVYPLSEKLAEAFLSIQEAITNVITLSAVAKAEEIALKLV